MQTPGRRLPDGAKWHGSDGRVKHDDEWLGGLLSQHTVTEHDDGTITVEPSILVDWPREGAPRRYHGFLRNGVWETLSDTDPMP